MNILDFVMVGSDDHEKSGDFYDAVFEPLKLKRVLKTQKYLGYAHSSDLEKVLFLRCRKDIQELLKVMLLVKSLAFN